MTRFLPVLLFLLTALFVWPLWPTVAAPASPNDRVLGQVLVKFKPDTSQNTIDSELKRHGAKVTDQVAAIGVLVLAVPQNAENRIITALLRNPNVEFAEADYLAFATAVPDTYFNNQWGMENVGQKINGVAGKVDADINAPTAWVTTLGGVKVAILDTGINESHSDLTGKIVAHQDFTGSSSSYNDVYGHGTHVAGIVAANTNNGKGVAGVCPQCLLLNGKVLNDSGSGAYSWIANGITWATNDGAKVINMSLGGSTSSRTLQNAVNYAWNNGVVITAAAGTSNNPSKTYPAAYTNAIAVAATDNQDKRAYFSSYGAKWVDVAAPGVFVFSTWKGATSSVNPQPECDITVLYKHASGTPKSTPIVS